MDDARTEARAARGRQEEAGPKKAAASKRAQAKKPAAAGRKKAPAKKTAAKSSTKGKGKPAERLTVVAAVTRDIEEITKPKPEMAESGLAATALALARELDSGTNSATSKSMCSRELRGTLDRLRELVPKGEEGDKLDGLRRQRADRLAGRSAS